MPIPRFMDDQSKPYEVILSCPVCHYAINKDRRTERWEYCPLCLRKGRDKPGKLVTKQVDY